MSAYPTPRTVKQVAELAAQGHPFSYLLGDFLDAFYHHPDRVSLADEPAILAGRHEGGAIDDAFLGGVAESLAASQGWRVPDWALEDGRHLSRPYFSIRAAAMRATLLLESPSAFRSRNLFVTANALSRA